MSKKQKKWQICQIDIKNFKELFFNFSFACAHMLLRGQYVLNLNNKSYDSYFK
jgi:hypothetical protein